jgi:hypothetical protein
MATAESSEFFKAVEIEKTAKTFSSVISKGNPKSVEKTFRNIFRKDSESNDVGHSIRSSKTVSSEIISEAFPDRSEALRKPHSNVWLQTLNWNVSELSERLNGWNDKELSQKSRINW